MTNPPSSQAEAMIRRVSPEGRALAKRDRERRQRATLRLAGRMVMAGLGIAIIAAAIDLAVSPIGVVGWLVAVAAFLLACIVIGLLSRAGPVILAASPLGTLPEDTQHWLEHQRGLLPRAVLPTLDSIGLRLRDMAPRLATLDADTPAADAVRRLLATDLPALVQGYEAVPPGMRGRASNGGVSADAHLLSGLALIDGEIDRMTEQLARGAFDELATQSRFLELKYDGAGPIG